MTASSPLPAPNLMPLMRYRDLAEAMTWLEQAFDFEKQIAVSDSDGAVIYGQMSYRGGLIMMGAVRDTDLDKLMRQPDEVGGIGTQSCYLVIEDADTHYARAQEAGAEIVLELKSDGLGRRGYSCRDPEGHIWNFGTYSPGKGLTLTRPDTAEAAPSSEEPASPPRARKWLMGLVALFAGLGALGWVFADDIRTNVTQQIAFAAGQQAAARAEQAYAELVKVRAEKRKAENALDKLARDLEAERARAKTAEGSKQSATDTIAAADAARKASDAERRAAQAARESAEKARQAAEAELASLSDELQRQKAALDEAVESRRVSEEKLAVQAAAAAETAKRLAAAEAAAQASKADASKAETSRTDAVSKTESAAPSASSEPAAQQAAAARTEDIETSATGARADREPAAASSAVSDAKPEEDEAEARHAKDPEPAERTGRRKSAGKGSRSVAKAKIAPAPRRLPAYNVDVRNVWPYNGWSN